MKRSFFFKAMAVTIGAIAIEAATPVVLLAQPLATKGVAMQTATFAIDNMTCALCPITVQAAMQAVKGVGSVDIDLQTKTATVAFDPALTTTEAIAASSTNAGYPASVMSETGPS
ncbi:heavy-metal-associated domain-containing protein [Rhizobium sp. P32RR-XVIII]|uniref:heavy-metal-associated domain-containing protein n=1 Tax=Rhizobium sp. P32RR-XVIII TaxID=2726738 RepID=UPI00248493CC|nr:heavy metal-associated domain-containing protein [Rhizobium sp. P32RR-XVIII]